jgi:hypothetical protein
MRHPVITKRHQALGRTAPRTGRAQVSRSYGRHVLWRMRTILAMTLGLSFASLIPVLTSTASAASPLNVFAGYFDTHTVPSSSNQPNRGPIRTRRVSTGPVS